MKQSKETVKSRPSKATKGARRIANANSRHTDKTEDKEGQKGERKG